ncbi:MAG: ATP-binding cassette domain-containing protein [Oscillospiraceae bacterium]|nr:ATP-binding cassette domain-containing protein [Oscillospiraceae bacterium]
MISIRGLRFRYGDRTVFDGLDMELGENAILTAPSGSGKTTLLKLIAGLLVPEAGAISGVPERIAFLFQEDRLLPWYSILKNAELVSDRAAASAMLEAVGLGDKLEARPGTLSGGERRRAALARALCAEADLLILDEPFKGLDPPLMEAMAALIRSRGVPYLAALHSEEETAALGGTAVRLKGDDSDDFS